MKILAIETSCDETACTIVEDGTRELVSVVATSKEFHEKTGGVVPEVASRKQLEFIFPVLERTIEEYCEKTGCPGKEEAIASIDALAVTVGPGLIGSLVVGVTTAKTLSMAWGKPLIPVNHLVGHIYANFIGDPSGITFPAVCLLVSGGHTDLVLMKGHGDLVYLGGTMDDAAGECFDKVARMMGISRYLGGAVLSKKALECKESGAAKLFPRPMLEQDNYDFSFSGLKTAVKRYLDSGERDVSCTSREFEEAVVDVLTIKTMKAVNNFGVKSLLVGGGVSANSRLRESLKKETEKAGVSLFIPEPRLCTDNAVYIASAAYFNNVTKALNEIKAESSLNIMGLV
ncbi:tRNA (adenosine(37)-N6)-threonylcarbamoyltransferase complex transferase subunit TsaD [candidate division WWE3 bacterium RIFOXYC2_FULL_42_13]|uniref:tRNA N6-adenosine threonylcarbamoyltransferase n=1 Tax=candidate division WWE3 bacterium TaxID=2053526 RepID=A0A3D0ZSB3_UNCKA|nr:MAG: tRNA (adenosine(37)-N6)-threonylcarbamoyltransferase complex transferase subunit TsaD [candidate division WWE3 bacterium RIFOXYA2_FULL_43_12]OGC73509.1 MAG: tRNA (adenosine(37)-N6)-threonylcarbamoyltransferase complex transferase subunit TsaD [candidate division WWE3 bacterium RIFOXYC2_FULL_42_13]HCC42304.1 tRNA (adenosine(37)-N6)-threonylcarbamoyltransferase complex transferase subunit TsaD [candidate division WWE3 bacterium]